MGPKWPKVAQAVTKTAVFERFVAHLVQVYAKSRTSGHLPLKTRMEYLTDCLLFAHHDVKDHVVGVLHADRADAAEVLNGLFDVVLDDAVVG